MMEIFLCNLLHKILKCFAEKYLMLSYFRLIRNILALEHAYFSVCSATVVPELRVKKS